MSMTFLERSQQRGAVVPLTREQVIASIRVRLMRCQELVVELGQHVSDQDSRAQVIRYLGAWAALENMLRTLYGYQGCVIGLDGCAKEAPVKCRHCSRAKNGGR